MEDRTEQGLAVQCLADWAKRKRSHRTSTCHLLTKPGEVGLWWAGCMTLQSTVGRVDWGLAAKNKKGHLETVLLHIPV